MLIKDFAPQYDMLLNYRKYLIEVLKGTNVSVTIGGSFALVATRQNFSDREVGDYDLSVYGSKDDIQKAYDRVLNASKLFNMYPYVNEYPEKKRLIIANLSDPTGSGQAPRKLEVLFSEGYPQLPFEIFTDTKRILAAKTGYIRENLKAHINPREKDIVDIFMIYEEELRKQSFMYPRDHDVLLENVEENSVEIYNKAVQVLADAFGIADASIENKITVFTKTSQLVSRAFINNKAMRLVGNGIKDFPVLVLRCNECYSNDVNCLKL